MADTFKPAIISGDGDSLETPVKFEPCDRATRIAAERRFICERFGVDGVDWTEQMHFTRPGFISDWVIELADGSTRSVCFDATVSLGIE